MAKQQTINFNAPVRKVVNCDTYVEPEQSKDETLRFRMQPRNATALKARCYDRGISMSEYVRQLLKVGDEYFDYIDVLEHEKDLLIPLLQKLSKR